MEFTINKLKWEIKELSNEEIHDLRIELGLKQYEEINEHVFNLGFTDNTQQKIYLNSTLNKQQLKNTLIHELVHAWLWSVGASYTQYCEDALCDTVSASYEFIHETVEEYFKEKK